MKKVFESGDDFQACKAAEAWCDARGIAVGAPERGSPRGLLTGYYSIAKWRNLSGPERRQLEGTMTGDMRNGPVTITLKGEEKEYRLLTPKQREHYSGSAAETESVK